VRLILIPCSAEKLPGGQPFASKHVSGLARFVHRAEYDHLMAKRASLLREISSSPRWQVGKYGKNRELVSGPDLGGRELGGLYHRTADRYSGNLYRAAGGLPVAEESASSQAVLILSALYGLLHPVDLIQDYNLQMSDSPAHRTWKQGLPRVLLHYIECNGVTEMFLLLGRSTSYMKVVMKALPMIRVATKEIVHFDVVAGSSVVTPRTHGQVLAELLRGRSGVVPGVVQSRL
jgi:hypothetical protein